MVLKRSPAAGDRENQGNVGRVDLLLVRDAHGPGQSTLGERLPERARQAIAGVGQDAAKARTCAAHTVDLGQRDLRLGTVGATPDAQALLRIGLANYFAGALILPYRDFLQAAEKTGYDIDLIAARFDVGFETICHRLSTLQRPDARGVPLFFIRVDRAGNISKRQSATDFHFSRIGGSRPLWNIYEAFARPGEILRQIAQMPDGRAYLWIARMVSHGRIGFGAPVKSFAVALGCDLAHAERLVYARGLNLKNPAQVTPIGPGCKLCERPACPQRAFPMVGRPLAVNAAEARFAPYSSGEG